MLTQFCRFVLLVALISFHQFVLAQKNTGGLTGQVVNADGKPAYVTIQLKKLKKATVTNEKGRFLLKDLQVSSDTLLISSVGSKTTAIAVAVAGNETTDLGTIRLNYDIMQLQDVEIKGNINHSYKSDYTFLSTKTQTASIDVPQSVSTVTKEMIGEKMELTVKEAADEVAGVNRRSGYDDYSIRGFKAENAQLLNGLRGYNTTYNSVMLLNVERVEVLKGPSAILYGNCDPGGTINIVTKKPLPTLEGSINIAGGSWDHFRIQEDITGPINKAKTLLYRLNAGYDGTKSFRDLFYSRSYQVAPSFSFVPNEKIQINVDLSLSHINTLLDRGQPGFRNSTSLRSTAVNLIASQEGDFLHETDIAANLSFSYKINDHISFNSGYLHYDTKQDVNEHGIHSYITDDSVNLYFSKWNYHTATNTLSNYFVFHFKQGKLGHQFLVGYNYINSSVKLNQQYYEKGDQFGAGIGIAGTLSLKNPTHKAISTDQYQVSKYESDATNVEPSVYTTQGIYVQEQVGIGKWKFLFGLREEMYEMGEDVADSTGDDDDELNVLLPRIGIVYKLKQNVSLFATYNKGFDPFEATTSTQIFKDPFKPITSELLEAGAKLNCFNNKLSASLSIYQLTLHNVAVSANDIANPDLYLQQGIDRSRGLETEVSGDILSNLSVSASWSHCVAKVLQSKIKSQEGTIVENAPKNATNSWIRYNFNKGLLNGFGLVFGHASESVRNTLQDGLMLPGYIVINAGVRYVSGHFTAALNVNNLTNTVYWIGGYNQVSKWTGATRNCMLNVGYNF